MPTGQNNEFIPFNSYHGGIESFDSGVLMQETIVGDKMYVKRTSKGGLQFTFYSGVFGTTKRIRI